MENPQADRYRILSLFSGCGGLDLGFAQLGAESLELEEVGKGRRRPAGTRFEIVWANDILSSPCETYSANFGAEIYKDPKELYIGKHRIFQGDVADIFFEDAVGNEKIDLVLGGFPCQDFSVIRGKDKRKGVRVKRGRLYCHFVRALAWLQPRMFVAENVKGLVSANNGLAYKWIIEDFRDLKMRWPEVEKEYGNHSFKKTPLEQKDLKGYEILFSDIVDFSDFGVPQARERLIIIGLREDLNERLGFHTRRKVTTTLDGTGTSPSGNLSRFPIIPIEVFSGTTLGSLQDQYKSVMTAFETSIREVNSERQQEFVKEVWSEYSMNIWEDYLRLNNKHYDLLNIDQTMKTIEKEHHRVLVELGYYGRPLDTASEFEDKSNSILAETENVKERMKHIPPGENHRFVRNTDYHVSGLMSNIYRRIHPLKPSPTIIAKGGGGTWGYHYAYNRQKMTNRERARIQAFPDSFIFKGKPAEVRSQLGEAVPPLASLNIAKAVVAILEQISDSS